jgi:hypothetical protein
MQKTDLTKESLYEVAGRVFYEAHVFGYRVTSFTNSGFLEDMHYVMPPISSTKIEFIKTHIFEILVAIILFGIYQRFMNQPKKSEVKGGKKVNKAKGKV